MIVNLKKGWSVIQDVFELGEIHGIYKRNFDPTLFGLGIEPWHPIERLEHLQLTLAANPYYGFGLRQFNTSPWWYRNQFDVQGGDGYATLTFKGVDYYADVWLNETYIGSHEGYQNPFTFDVSGILKEKDNLLVVKVSAPWETDVMAGQEHDRGLFVLRNQVKGTYEHNDTFIPRDVNPIGIWNDVEVEVHSGIRMMETPWIPYELENDYKKAIIRPTYQLFCHYDKEVEYSITVRLEGDVRQVARVNGKMCLKEGENELRAELEIMNPQLWTVWERGYPYRYSFELQLVSNGTVLLEDTHSVGIRKIELVRNEKEMYFVLNGEKLYLRGATYFPDVYVSANFTDLYRRDISNAKLCGLNSWRIHVHTEKEELYDLCDREGILLIQDSDFNWIHPIEEEWSEKAVEIFAETIKRLRNHPSLFCWVLLNEPRLDIYLTERPGPQMIGTLNILDPGRAFILSSWSENEPMSGDSHNYTGSLIGVHTHYTDIFNTTEKFNTEFGMDATPVFASLRKEPELVEILGDVVDEIDKIHYYQYRYIKYFVEHYRLMKFAPCGGHYQFLFTDTAPTSQFGLYDRQGIPKGGQCALLESNQPLAVIMEHGKEKPVAVWVINDLLKSFENATIEILIWDDQENVVMDQSLKINVKKNDRILVSSLDFEVKEERDYTVYLRLLDADGKLLIENRYESAFRHPEHIKEHPHRAHNGLALRTYWAKL